MTGISIFDEPNRQQSGFGFPACSEAGSTFLWENFTLTCAITCCIDGAVCCLCTWPCARRVTRWTSSLSVFLFRDCIEWLFLWPGRGSSVPERPSLWAEVLEPAACWPHSWASPWNSLCCCCCQWCSLIALSRAQQSAALSASACHSMHIWLELLTELLCFVIFGFFLTSIWLPLWSKGFTLRKIAFEAWVLQKQLLFRLWDTGGRKQASPSNFL